MVRFARVGVAVCLLGYPLWRWPLAWRSHREENMLKDQAYGERMGVSPRNSGECGKYNPIERCWGILELQWNGAKLLDVETMLGWAKKMTWKGLQPVVELSRQVYTKGIALGKVAMEAVEARLKRDPQ